MMSHAGSTPVGPATKGSPHQGGPFAFAGLRVTGLLPQCAAGAPDRRVVGGVVVQCYQRVKAIVAQESPRCSNREPLIIR